MSNWLDSAWKYRRSITIDNSSNSNTLTDYQIKLTLNNGNFDFSKANSDGSDIRFTDSNGVTKLNYWIESWDSTNQTATVWIKVNSIPASSTKDIYIYYGNPSAASESNGDDTFVFFDDFNSSSLDSNKWDDYTSGYTISDSEITYHSQDESWKYLRSKQTFSPPIRLVYHIAYQGDWGGTGTKYDGFKGNALGGSHLDYSLSDDNGPFVGFGEGIVDWNETPAVGNGIDSTKVDGGNASGGNNIYTTHDADIKWDTSNATLDKIWNNTHYNNTFTTNIPTDPEPIIFGVKGRNDYERRIYVDYVIVANYTSPAPSQTVGNEELTPRNQHNSSFYNIYISCTIQGAYSMLVSQLTTSSYSINIHNNNESKFEIYPNINFDSYYQISNNSVTNTSNSKYSILSSNNMQSTYTINIYQQVSSNYYIITSATNISKYDIITTIKQSNQSSYSIDIYKTLQSKYNILISQNNNSIYKINAKNETDSSYTINIGQENISKYAIQVSQENISRYGAAGNSIKIYSEYKIWQIFHLYKESKSSYLITNYDWISVENQSRYGINWSGVTSIDEREIATPLTYAILNDERKIHAQLWVTHTDERTIITDNYHTVFDNRNLFVERIKLQSERLSTYERHYTKNDDKQLLWGGYFIETNERQASTLSFEQIYSNRYTISEQRETLDSDRKCYTFCLWNSGRYIATKYWWPTDRYCVSGYCIPFRTYADQRTLHAQVNVTKLAFIRQCYTESCSYSFTITVTPKYQSFACGQVQSNFRELFSSKVVTNINTFKNIPIDWAHSGFDLVLIKEDGSWWKNLGTTPLIYYPVNQLTENTYLFKGYLIHRHKPLYTRIEFQFQQFDGFTDPNAYYKYLIEHGYIKLEINNTEIRDMQAQIDCDQPMYPIPFKFYIYKHLLGKMRLNITYAYPYKKLVVHKNLLYPKAT